METILGIRGKDFVMLAADCTHAHSIMVLKDGELHFLATKFLHIIFNLFFRRNKNPQDFG